MGLFDGLKVGKKNVGLVVGAPEGELDGNDVGDLVVGEWVVGDDVVIGRIVGLAVGDPVGVAVQPPIVV